MADIETQGQSEELEIIPIPEADISDEDVFKGLSTLPVTDEQSRALLAPADPSELNILPTGEIYPPQIMVRRRLIAAFGPAGWGMRPFGRAQISGNQVVQEWGLYANGRFISYTAGGADYQANNSRLNWSDALESAKSNALVRLCKDLGMFSECWDHGWVEDWKAQNAVKVWVQPKDGAAKPLWRRLDSRAFFDETGLTADSPNKDRYIAPGQNVTKSAAPKQAEPTIKAEEAKSEEGQDPAPAAVKIWGGKKWQLVNVGQAITAASANWFTATFFGKGKAFENQYSLFGNSQGTGHLGKYYKMADGTPRRYLFGKEPMSVSDFAELVAYAWWVQDVRDEGKGHLALPRYSEKWSEFLKNNPDQAAVEPSAAERAVALGMDLDTLAQWAYGDAELHVKFTDLDELRTEAIVGVIGMVEMGGIKADDIEQQVSVLLAG